MLLIYFQNKKFQASLRKKLLSATKLFKSQERLSTKSSGEVNEINPSGGVLSTNPIGATALIRIGEAALQVMGRAGERQVSDVRTAMATAFGSCYWFEATVLRSAKP